jgi:hypothetical protein
MGILAASLGVAMARLKGAESDEVRAIKAQFTRQVERIKSLEVSYKLETKSNLSPEKLRALPEYQNQMFLPQDEWREAFKGAMRYRRQIQPERIKLLAPMGEDGLFVPPDPPADAPAAIKENQKELRKQYDRAVANMKAMEARGAHFTKRDPSIRDVSERDITRAYNGKTLWMKQPTSKQGNRYLIWPANQSADWFQMSAYLSAAGLNVPDPSGRDMVRKAQEVFQLVEWIKNHPYDLEPKTEVVDGSTCVVLEGSLNSWVQPGLLVGNLTDRIWLDRDHGLLMRKREMYRDGKVMSRWENSHLKEVEPGIWLPLSCRHDTFAMKPHPDLKDKPVMTEEVQVQSLEINHVPDDRFDMTPQKGDSIDDLRGRL